MKLFAQGDNWIEVRWTSRTLCNLLNKIKSHNNNSVQIKWCVCFQLKLLAKMIKLYFEILVKKLIFSIFFHSFSLSFGPFLNLNQVWLTDTDASFEHCRLQFELEWREQNKLVQARRKRQKCSVCNLIGWNRKTTNNNNGAPGKANKRRITIHFHKHIKKSEKLNFLK